MTDALLLARALLDVDGAGIGKGVGLSNLSAIVTTATPEGETLWLGTDETIEAPGFLPTPINALIGLTRSADQPLAFDRAALVPLRSLLPPEFALILDEDGEELEIDIEGMDAKRDELWITGSHSAKRRKPSAKGKRTPVERLATVESEGNRFLIARIPLEHGRPVAQAGERRSAAARLVGDGDELLAALRDDDCFGPFLQPVFRGPRGGRSPLPGKDNGFDIEGLAMDGGALWLGLRGPVLRGWAGLLRLAPAPEGSPFIELGEIGDEGRPYRKLFVHLRGMGVRDLCFDGDDLLILAGPTMDLDGVSAVWRLREPNELPDGAFVGDDGDFADHAKRLTRLFDVPSGRGVDKPEGLMLFRHQGEAGVLVVYDTPAPARRPRNKKGRPVESAVYADVFRLKRG